MAGRAGRRTEQLGWPRFDIHYRPGTRDPIGTTVTLTEPDGTPFTVEVETHARATSPSTAGPGYGGDPDWGHGQWKGRDWVERFEVDMNDPELVGRLPFGMKDHVGKATIGDAVGWGLFEHATVGRHAPPASPTGPPSPSSNRRETTATVRSTMAVVGAVSSPAGVTPAG